jgi:hypothetical protein
MDKMSENSFEETVIMSKNNLEETDKMNKNNLEEMVIMRDKWKEKKKI